MVRFTEDRGDIEVQELDDRADFDGWTVRYNYTVEYYGNDLEIEGEVTFPEL